MQIDMKVFRYRLLFQRDERAKNMSHLEQIKFFRNFLTNNLPFLAKDRKISFGPAISEGYESLSEYIDVYFNERKNFQELKNYFVSLEEKGFKLLDVISIPIFFPSIESSAQVAEYEIFLENFNETIINNAAMNECKKEIIYERKKEDGSLKLLNIKDFIYKYSFEKEKNKISLYIRYISGRTVKPEIVIKLFFNYEGSLTKIIRKAFYWIDSKGNLNRL